MIENIDTQKQLAEFVRALRRDLQSHPGQWANTSLEGYLEGLAAWIEDMDGYYSNAKLPTPTHPTWKNVAEMLTAAKYYE